MEPEAVTEAEAAVAAHVQAGGAGLSAVGLFGRSSCGAHANLRLRVFRDLRDGCGAASTAQAVVAAVMAAAARMAAVVFLIFIVKTSSNSCSCRCAGERLACRGALFESD